MTYGELDLFNEGCHWELSLIGQFAPEMDKVFKIEWDFSSSAKMGTFQTYFAKNNDETAKIAQGDTDILPDMTLLKVFEDDTGYEIQSGLMGGPVSVCTISDSNCNLPTIMRFPNDKGMYQLMNAVEGFLAPHFVIFESIFGGEGDDMEKVANSVVYRAGH